MKKKGETRKVRTSFFLFQIRSSIRKHKKRKKGINPAPVAAPDGRVEQTVFFDFGPEENGIRSTLSTRTRRKTKRKTKTDDGLCSKMTTNSPLPISARKGSGGLDAEQDAQPRQALFSGCSWFSPFSQGGKEWQGTKEEMILIDRAWGGE